MTPTTLNATVMTPNGTGILMSPAVSSFGLGGLVGSTVISSNSSSSHSSTMSVYATGGGAMHSNMNLENMGYGAHGGGGHHYHVSVHHNNNNNNNNNHNSYNNNNTDLEDIFFTRPWEPARLETGAATSASSNLIHHHHHHHHGRTQRVDIEVAPPELLLIKMRENGLLKDVWDSGSAKKLGGSVGGVDGSGNHGGTEKQCNVGKVAGGQRNSGGESEVRLEGELVDVRGRREYYPVAYICFLLQNVPVIDDYNL
jgi:hypothetical protein